MSGSHEMSGPWPGPERRARSREITRRRAVCSRPGIDDVLADGMVVDISPNGLQIRTAVPLARGDSIEIEVYPRDDADRGNTILVRGRVARVSAEGGEFAMGIQLTWPGASTGPAAVVEFSSQARDILASLPGQLRGRGAGAPSPLAFAEHQAGEAEIPVVFRKGRRTAHPRRALLLLLLLLLLVVAGWWLLQTGLGSGPKRGVALYSPATRGVGEEGVGSSLLDSAEGGAAAGRAKRYVHADRRGAMRLAKAQELLLTGHTESAHAAFAELAQDPGHDALSRFVAHLGMAWSLAMMDQRDDAAEAIRAALARAATEQDGAIPEPWVGVAESMQADLAHGDPPWTALGFLVDALVLGEMRAPDENLVSEDDAGAMRIEVSTSQYLLTVWRGDLALGRFPVGLGQDGATPRGDFALVNKIRDPSWYNRGDVVPPGDAENPLGALWMGLADENGPTPIGIHPTDDPSSIGGNESLGCIRMRPGDAERVFRWCPVGTPVRVGS